MQSLMQWIHLTIYIEAFMMRDILQLKRQTRLKQVQMRGICACMQNGLHLKRCGRHCLKHSRSALASNNKT